MEEKNLLEDTKLMLRLQAKSKLIKDCETIFEFLSMKEKCLSKKFNKLSRKSIYKDFKNGLKKINKRMPVYVELPKIKSEGNGMYSMEEHSRKNKEIIVSDYPAVVNVNAVAVTDKDPCNMSQSDITAGG